MTATSLETPEEEPAAGQAVDRAAALDDYLGGHAGTNSTGRTPTPDFADDSGKAMARLIDTILLLRQAAAADGAVPGAAPAEAPRSIGRHAIIRPAGAGGFAIVWEGFDTVLRRPVAVKVIRPEALLSETARRRFVREAEIAARLVHPHIVTIFDVDEDGGREFIAAEFCSGGSLAAWLERHPGPIERRDAARVVRALAGAAHYAHSAGVVHRDIKPANVLLAPAPAGAEKLFDDPPGVANDGPGLTVKLGDFGLGKLHQDGDGADALSQLTRTNTSIGTPAWMAPEQIDQSFGQVGPATDVHALGLLLYRLLTGRELRSAGTTAETYRQVLVDDPMPANRVTSGIPRDLAAVCMKCLAKKPADRYESAAAFAADLDRWLDGRPTVARPVSYVGWATRWIRRRPIVAGLGAAAVAASVVAIWAGAERMREQQAAVRHQDELRRQAAVAELRRGFEALRAGQVAGALEQLDKTQALDPQLATSLAGRWLLRRTHGERQILLAPAADSAPPSHRPRDLYTIALRSAGTTAAVAGGDGTIRLLHGLDAVPTTNIVSAHDEVNDVAFSPDGALLASVGQDGQLRWWHVTGQGLLAAGSADPGAGPLYAAAFTPDGGSITIGGEDRVVRLVNLSGPDQPVELFRFEQPSGKSPEIESLAFVDPRSLAASCGDSIVILDASTGRLVREFARPTHSNRNAVYGSLTVSSDGRRLLACGTDEKAHIWDVATGQVVLSLPKHPAWVQGCCFMAGGSRVATSCRDGGLRIFDAVSGALLRRLVGHVGRVWSVTVEPSGTLLTCGADGTVRRWNPGDDIETAGFHEWTVVGFSVEGLAAEPRADDSSKSRTLIALDGTGTLSRVDRAGYAGARFKLAEDSRATEMALDGSRRRLAVSWSQERPMAVLDLAGPPDREAIHVSLPNSIDPRQALLCWIRTGDLVVCSRQGHLCVVSSDLSRMLPIESPLVDPVHVLTAAPAGATRVAAAGKISAILQVPCTLAAGQCAPPLVLDIGEEAATVTWSPDASMVAFGTRSGRILLLDATTGIARGTLVSHERSVVAIAFSRDGRALVTADQECVRISDVATLTTLDEIRPGWQIRTMQLTADDSCVILGGHAVDAEHNQVARLAVMELD